MEKLKAENITVSYNGENTIEDINIHINSGVLCNKITNAF